MFLWTSPPHPPLLVSLWNSVRVARYRRALRGIKAIRRTFCPPSPVLEYYCNGYSIGPKGSNEPRPPVIYFVGKIMNRC